MLPKTNYTSETKCLAVFLMGNRWPLKQLVQILGLLRILLGNDDFVLLRKAHITQKLIYLPNFFFVNKVRAGTSGSLQYLIWLKSKTVKIYSVVQSVKLLLALSIYMCISSTKAATLMTSLFGPDAELRCVNWFNLLHMPQSLF